jgi:hypothetical protein
MPVLTQEAPRLRRFAGWSVACWIVLLLAAFGGVLYLRHGDYGYLLCTLAVIVVCAGGILRQPWARGSMRALALLLAAWALLTAGLMVAHWDQFEQARQHALTQPHADLVLLVIEQARRSYLLGLVFKALLIPLLLWLVWRLGTPAARAQFALRK